jgi:hypothetical protein
LLPLLSHPITVSFAAARSLSIWLLNDLEVDYPSGQHLLCRGCAPIHLFEGPSCRQSRQQLLASSWRYFP